MNATTITFTTRTRSKKAAQHVEPRKLRRSFFLMTLAKIRAVILMWLLSYPVEII